MQAPGLSRAVSLAIVGFMVGALLALVIRGLQGLTPVWDAGIGIIMATFFSAGFFVYGIGAFDPRLSLHGEAAELAAAAEAAKQPEPRTLLISSTWTIIGGTLLLFVVLFFIGSIWGGLTLVTTDDPLASAARVGFQPVTVHDLAHLIVLLATPVVLIGWILLLVTFAWVLFLGPLRPKQGHFLGSLVRFALLLAIPGNLFLAYVQFGVAVDQGIIWIATILWALILYAGPFRPTQPGWFGMTWRLVLVALALGVLHIIIPLWFDNVAPFRQLPFVYVLVETDRATSYALFDWLNTGMTQFFATDTLLVSQVVIFVGLILFFLVNLLVVAGGLGLLFFALNRGLAVSKVEAAEYAKLPPEEKQSAPPIGKLVGRSAAWLAKTMRKAPNVLQG